MKKYHIGEHTADLELRVWGRDLKELFQNTARAILDYAAPDTSPGSRVKKDIFLQAESLEELFISWLNEILFWLEVEGFRCQRFYIKLLNGTSLRAALTGKRIDLGGGNAGPEIKAATYHDLYLRKKDSLWEAHVIFDL